MNARAELKRRHLWESLRNTLLGSVSEALAMQGRRGFFDDDDVTIVAQTAVLLEHMSVLCGPLARVE